MNWNWNEPLRQAVLDDRLHAALPEGAARLLVGQHLAQRADLGGEIGDVALRAVDDGKPLVELLQVLDRVLRTRLHRLPDAVRHAVEPLGDGARERGLAAGQRFAERLQPSAGFGLDTGELGHALLGLVGTQVLPRRLDAAGARAARELDGDREQDGKQDQRKRGRRVADANGEVADHEQGLVHSGRSSAIRRAGANRKRTSLRTSFGADWPRVPGRVLLFGIML